MRLGEGGGGGGVLCDFTSIFITRGSRKDCCVLTSNAAPSTQVPDDAAGRSFQGEKTGLMENVSSLGDL